MSTTIALREDLDTTLSDLRQQVIGSGSTSSRTEQINLDRVRVNAEGDTPSIALSDAIEVPLTSGGMGALADSLDIPTPFFTRLGKVGGISEQASLITTLLNYTNETGMVAEFSDGGLLGLSKVNALRISPYQIVDVAARVLGSTEAPVQRMIYDTANFAFDVHVPIDSERGVKGDAGGEQIPEELRRYSWVTKSSITNLSQVGDVTTAGLRISMDRKRNLAPTVQPWMMRLACTNGMETTTQLSKIDARGMSVEEVLLDLEAKAQIAFERVESEIDHFYDMRNMRVDNPERRLRAIARERSIPDRSLMRMLDVAPEALGSETSEFDIACLISNFGNHSSTRNDGGRLLLERGAGAAVTEHAVRCTSCNHVLSED